VTRISASSIAAMTSEQSVSPLKISQ